MAKHGMADDPTILEAVDNLSSMAELDLEEFKQEQRDEAEGTVRLKSSRWLDPRDEVKTLSAVKNTFKTVHKYLEHVYAKEGEHLQDREMQRGIQSIIALANEAAQKVDICSSYFKRKESVRHSKEFKELIDFYEQKILRRFEEVLKKEEGWEEEFKEEVDVADIERRGLKDLETVTRDRDYELFYITKEDGSHFYHKNLIRHVRLVADFDQLIGSISDSDPLLRIKIIQDRDLQISASEIKEKIRTDLDRWIKKAGKFRDDPFVLLFYRAVMALLLSSNPRNQIGQTQAKCAFDYFKDFQVYLRATLNNVDYLALLENPPEEMDPFYEEMLGLIHKVCYFVILQRFDRADGLALLTRILDKEPSKKKTKSTTSSLALWNEVLEDHEKLHAQLQRYPSGPLFKVLDILHDARDESFDPYLQDDRPSQLYTFQYSGKKIEVAQMACPTRQKQINGATIIPEFAASMRYLAQKEGKALLINLQDRTSWKEFARCQAIEEYQKKAEVKRELDVITLPKTTDFYLQTDVYLQNNNAKEFLAILYEQIKSEKECGFLFPKHYNREVLHDYCKKAIKTIHKLFFAEKENLSRKNRLDFIEIFYHFLYLKFLDLANPTHLIFSAKDSLDHPAVTTASFYAFVKIMSGEFDWKEEEKEFFIASVFLPALLIRERAVDSKILSRQISMLAVLTAELEVNRDLIHKGIDALFKPNFALELHVKRPE